MLPVSHSAPSALHPDPPRRALSLHPDTFPHSAHSPLLFPFGKGAPCFLRKALGSQETHGPCVCHAFLLLTCFIGTGAPANEPKIGRRKRKCLPLRADRKLSPGWKVTCLAPPPHATPQHQVTRGKAHLLERCPSCQLEI